MNQQDLTDISPYLRLKVSPRARRLALRLDSKERIINLVIPRRTSFRKAYEFAKSHEEWINKRLKSLPEPIPFSNSITLPIAGIDRVLSITYDETLKKTDIYLKYNTIIVTSNQQDPSRRIERFLKNHANEIITPLAMEKAYSLGRKIRGITVRDQKTRWGSCSNEGKLSFSWRLIFAPPPAMDYVISHEVAHLKHLNHSKAFWNTCRSLCMDYLEGHIWMRNHGHELMRYGQSYTPELPEE